MSWDTALLNTKVFLYVAVGIVLSLAGVVASVTGSVLAMAVLAAGGHPNLGLIAAILVAMSLYASGMAGRSYVMTVVLPEIFFTKSDLGVIDEVASKNDK